LKHRSNTEINLGEVELKDIVIKDYPRSVQSQEDIVREENKMPLNPQVRRIVICQSA
jgi:hypothetical protein